MGTFCDSGQTQLNKFLPPDGRLTCTSNRRTVFIIIQRRGGARRNAIHLFRSGSISAGK